MKAVAIGNPAITVAAAAAIVAAAATGATMVIRARDRRAIDVFRQRIRNKKYQLAKSKRM
jgi:hypothetical protein